MDQTVPQLGLERKGVMVAVVMVLIVAGTAGMVRAQTCETDALTNLWFACEQYVSTPSMVTPDKNSLLEMGGGLSDVLTSLSPGAGRRGGEELMELRVEVKEARRITMLHAPSKVTDKENGILGLRQQLTEKSLEVVLHRKKVLLENSGSATYGTDLAKVYDLPQDCKVAANMTQCPSPGPAYSSPGGSSTPTTVAPTNPLSSLLPPSSKSSGGSSSSLGVPIGASVGGGSVFILIIYLILRYACKMHLKWDLNQPCGCCGPRKPQKEPDDKPNGVGVPPVTTMNSAALNAPYQVGVPPVMRINSAALNAPYRV